MRKLFARLLLATPLAFGVVALTSGCNPEGPAEKAGEKLDNAGREIRDAVDPAGPAEKAGRAIDNATDGLDKP